MANIISTRLALPRVTLCAATSVNLAATIRALEVNLGQIDFASCKLFTDKQVKPDHPGITVVRISRIDSSKAYSDFVLSQMVEHVETTHCLVAQWDGHLLDAKRWREQFLDYDYIGARWPQFADGHDVGNGGFSLRSRRLMEACREAQFHKAHPEDVAIGRINRLWLESRGMRFAPPPIADLFATERTGSLETSFGYHGVWHMPRVTGVKIFWKIYRGLDDRSTIRGDFMAIVKGLLGGSGGIHRVIRMMIDRVKDARLRW